MWYVLIWDELLCCGGVMSWEKGRIVCDEEGGVCVYFGIDGVILSLCV